MLAGAMLKEAVHNGTVFNLIKTCIIDDNIQLSSIDMTVLDIYPSSVNNGKVIDGLDFYILNPGETVIVKIKEFFNLSNDLSGVLFPPNKLSRNGIVMTNPGHIDPGFKGYITVCLVNMGRCSVELKANQIIATLLLFRTSEITKGYDLGEGVGVSSEQLQRMGKDFAGLDERIPKIVRDTLTNWAAIILTIAGIMLTILALAIPYVTQDKKGYYEMQEKLREQEAEILKLKKAVNSSVKEEPYYSYIKNNEFK
ncbi:hypothetical protein I5Q07_00795 [Serratia ureilytica]|uniref:dCTP deaminase n=1 Tax=Serratia ureilytica TaxID=300181 RepID=UPI0018D79730|nr:hypothetical protein [Serratia ureilytica]MBH2895164.1 hypothetical protein [Serratia ureilytica]MBH3019181.1 hypothetical protein [Serratia ureilytica]